MAQKVASLYAEITADTTGLEKGLARTKTGLEQTSKTTKETTANVSAMGGAMKLMAGGALAAAGFAMVNFGKQSIAAASDVEESASKFKYVFGPAAEGAGEVLDEFAAAAGRSKFQLRDTAAGFGGVLEGMLGSKEAAADMSVQLSKLTTDLASFYNVSESEASTALTSGLVGETEPMRRFGVLLSAAAIEAEILGSGMAATKAQITESMKAQARFNLIMEATATAQGDAERTSDSYSNQQRAMQASVEELSVALGQVLIPIATEAAGTFAQLAQDLKIVFDVAKAGKPTIDGIVQGNIAQAQSVDDLVIQYQKIQKQLGMWGGLAVILTGTQDDLADSGDDVHEALLRMASGADEYVEAAKAMGIVGNNMGQMSEAQARLYYEEAVAALAVADAMEEQAQYAAMYLDYQKALYASTEDATTATTDYGWSLDGVKRNYEGLYQSGFGAFADTLREQEEAARAAGEAFNGYFVSALEDGESIYGKWVTTATAMGGRTEAQEQNFQELSAAAERLRGNIRSLQGGTAGLGLTQDELNEKLAKEYEQLALVEGAMAPLAGITTTYSDAQQKWVVDSDAMTEALYNQIASMSDNAYETAGAAYALGLYDETQLATALNAAITEEKIKNLAQAFADGEISAGDLKTEMDNIVASSPYVTEIDVLTDEAIGNIDKVSSKLAGVPRNITSKISVIVDDQSKGAPGGGASDSNRGGGNPNAGGGASDSGGGNPNELGAYATGGVVPGPVGMPQLAIVHGGEEVLTPAQRATRGGGGVTINQTFISNTRETAALAWAQSERIRRQRMDGI